GCLHGEFGKIVRGDVQHFWVVREFALQNKESINGSLGLIEAHGATGCGHRGAILELLVGCFSIRGARNCQLEGGEGFQAASLGRQVNRVLDASIRRDRGGRRRGALSSRGCGSEHEPQSYRERSRRNVAHKFPAETCTRHSVYRG